MGFSLFPDYRFKTFDEVTVEFLTEIGIKGLILDIDNTLEPYENALPGEHVKKWLDSLFAAGIGVAFVSNNNKERVELFNKELRLPAFYKAGKPFKKNILKAMEMLGTVKENTMLMGDQIFTDVWAARNAKIKATLVPPIKDKKDAITRLKRFFERGIIKRYEKKMGDEK